VRWFNGESVSDVLRVGEVAASLAVVVDVALRVNPGSLELETSLETAGRRSRFGMSPDAIRDSGLLHADLPGLRVNGFHGFYGSQVKSRNDLACVIGATSRALASFLPDSRATLERVSLGLGLPAPYDDAPTVDIDNLRDPILNEVLALRSLTGNPELEVCMEMGRYLVAGAGMFVTRVVDRKQSFGLNWLLVDGGMQSFYRPIMMRQGHRISAVRVTDRTPEFEVVSIGGSCMTSEDVYARDIALPRCEEGDLIVFHEAGAYGHSMSLVSFLGMKAAREYVLE
jgi:diaminopimelate decarboxylase